MASRRKRNTGGNAAPTLFERIDEFEERRQGPQQDSTEASPLRVPQGPASDQETILPSDWESPPRLRSTRRVWAFRFSVVTVFVAIGAAAAFGILWYLSVAEREADQVLVDYRLALLELETAIDAGESAMLGITDAALDAAELQSQLGPFSRFRAVATGLSSEVRSALPSTPPLAPRDALDELEPLKSSLALVAGRADGLASRLNKAFDYRVILGEIFVLPDLPREPSQSEIDELSPELAGVMADAVAGLNRLPTDPFLDPHRSQAQGTLEFLRTWEVDYLTALRRGELESAGLLALRAAREIDVLRADLAARLDEFRLWAADEFAGLRNDVAGALVRVGPVPD